jgi:hypothetical protein
MILVLGGGSMHARTFNGGFRERGNSICSSIIVEIATFICTAL